MKKYIFFIFFYFLLSIQCQAQIPGYIIKGDTAYSDCHFLYDSRNPIIIYVIMGKKDTISYTPEEVSRFGANENIEYVSRSIEFKGDSQKVFLRKIIDGQTNLYFLEMPNKRLFLEGKVFVELTKDNYLNILNSQLELCKKIKDQSKLLKFNKNVIANIIRYHNNNQCKNIPFVSFGPLLRYSRSVMNLKKGSYIDNLLGDFHMNSTTYQFGMFLEYPFWKTSNLYLLNQIYYGKSSYIQSYNSLNLDQDIKIEFSKLHLEISPAYSFDIKNLRPYVYFGGNVGYIVDTETSLFIARKNDNTIIFEKRTDFLDFPDFYFGFQVGIGIKYFYIYNHYLSFDFGLKRYISTYFKNDFFISLRANL